MILALAHRVYPATGNPAMTQDLFTRGRLAVFGLAPVRSTTLGLGR